MIRFWDMGLKAEGPLFGCSGEGVVLEVCGLGSRFGWRFEGVGLEVWDSGCLGSRYGDWGSRLGGYN